MPSTTDKLQTIVEKLPPQNLEAEESVLGALLIDRDAMMKIADRLSPDDFYHPGYRSVFEASLELYEKRIPIDLLSLSNRLQERGQLDSLGGRTKLAHLATVVPSAGRIIHYADIVQKKATLRRLIRASGEVIDLAFMDPDDVTSVLDLAEQKLFGVSQKMLKQNFVPIQSILTDTFDRIDDLHKGSGKLRGVPTGFHDLDNLLAGLQGSDLVILAARPSVGKTTLALDMARHVATVEKKPVGIFSLEMSKEQLVDRLLCSQAGVDLWKMRTGHLSDREDSDDFPRIGEAMAQLSEAPIFIDDSATATVMEIRTKARRLQSEHGLGLLMVDYLQLIQGGGSESRVQEVSEITRSLKSIARELNIPVLALSQLSRTVETRTPPIPKLFDLRESGSIEQDADVVMFIYREELYKRDTNRRHIADIMIAKHRNGPTGQVEVFFDERRVRFQNLAKRSQAPPPISSSEGGNAFTPPPFGA